MTVDEIERAIAKLSPEERASLREWLVQFDATDAEAKARPQRNIAPEGKAGPEATASRLGKMAGRAFADFRKRMRDP
jgi:hypothetical protein